MASITIRQLDETLKRRLRLRAARNGRSMEDEARTILRHAASLDEGTELGDTPQTRAPHSTRRRSSATADAPAPADLRPKLAGGHAEDLASAALLAAARPVLLAPAMNPRMWEHRATRRNLVQLIADGVAVVGPNAGEMAEAGEAGIGRMAEPLEIVAAVLSIIARADGERTLAGKRVVVTSGPTHEPIDPERYIAHRPSP